MMGEDSEGCGECKPDEVMHFARCHDDSLAALAAETFCTAMRSLGLLTRGADSRFFIQASYYM